MRENNVKLMSEPEYDWSFLRKMSSRRFTENVIFETLYCFNIHRRNQVHYAQTAMFSSSVHISEPQHDKIKKIPVRPAKTQISLGIRPV